MILQMYSIYDKKGQHYAPPEYCSNEQTAIRHFKVLFQNVKSMLNRFPNDYEVWHVGQFNDEVALLQSITKTFKWHGQQLAEIEDVHGQQTMFIKQDDNQVHESIKEVKNSKAYKEAKAKADNSHANKDYDYNQKTPRLISKEVKK